jgi:5-methylcytosine-specific restriction protein A
MPRRPRFHRPFSAGLDTRQKTSKAERDKFYTGAAWRRCRSAFLACNPLCVDCLERGLLTSATIPHHARERLDRPDLALDMENLVALCSPCHTARHQAPGGGRIPRGHPFEAGT